MFIVVYGLPAVTCYTEQLNCTGGATNPTIIRPTTIDSCCSNGGVSFDNGVGECINCAGM